MTTREEQLALEIYQEAYGTYDDHDPEADEIICLISDWIEGQKLPGLYDKDRRKWITNKAEEWLEEN